MKDNVIRKRLKELGLSSQGDRKALESRLQRYTVLYNAECDKTHPRPVSELIKQCEEEENLEKRVQKPSNVNTLYYTHRFSTLDRLGIFLDFNVLNFFRD